MPIEISFFIEPYILAFLVVSVPFFLLFGIKWVAEWFVSFLKVRQGFFSVNWVMKNHQFKEKMIKPKGQEVIIEDKTTPFVNDPTYTAFKGNKKMIFFSRVGERLRQIKVAAKTDEEFKKKGTPPDDLFNDMLLQAEQVGKLFSVKGNRLELMLIVAAVLLAAGAAIVGFVNLGQMQVVDARLNETISVINALNIPQPAAAQSVIANATVLTGG